MRSRVVLSGPGGSGVLRLPSYGTRDQAANEEDSRAKVVQPLPPLVLLALTASLLNGRRPRHRPHRNHQAQPVGTAAHDGHVRLRRHAAGPGGEVRQGRRDADLQGADEGGRDGRQRDAAGVPAEHRRRLVHDGHRHLPGRARLDEQHVLPRRDAFSTGPRSPPPARCRRTRSRTRPSAPARRSRRSTGSAALRQASPGPTVDFTNFFSNRGVLVGAANRGRAGGLGVLRRHLPGRDARGRQPAGSSVPAGDPAAPRRSRRRWSIPTTLRRAEPEPHLQRLLLRQRRRRRGIYDRAIVSPVGKTGASTVDRPQGRRLPSRSS